MNRCSKCDYDSTPLDPCQCQWEAMKIEAETLGRQNAGQWGENPLSGEWAGGPTPKSLAEDVGLDPEAYDLLDQLCDAFEDGYWSDDNDVVEMTTTWEEDAEMLGFLQHEHRQDWTPETLAKAVRMLDPDHMDWLIDAFERGYADGE